MGKIALHLPITNAIHNINHTQTKRVCMLQNNHKQFPVLVKTLSVTDDIHDFYNLMPGLYAVIIDDIKYYFDLYIVVNDVSPLTIKSPNNAYVLVGGKRYIINLYRDIDVEIMDNNLTLNNTVNNHIEVMVIDGKTTQIPYLPNDIHDRYAIIPNDNIIPSSLQQSSESLTLEELQLHNKIFYDIDYEKFGEHNGLISFGVGIESDSEDKSIYNPYNIHSISKISITSSDSPITDISNNYITETTLQNNIKSLPNGIKDTLILNSEQYQAHVIYRIGRSFLTGGETYIFISDKSDSNSWLFWVSNSNIRMSSLPNNVICSHLQSKSYDEIVNGDIGICVSTQNHGNGLFIRIPSMEVNNTYTNKSTIFRKWLQNQVNIGRPIIVEYHLSSYKYKTILLDKYRVKTFYNKTYIKNNNNYNISYFYKTLK